MSKVKVLFFAADPFSAPPNGRAPRLLLDEDVRQIKAKVRAAEYRDALDFDLRLAARSDDLLQALHETQPQVVHFSGHGGSEGLVLVDSDGHRPHPVAAAALAQLFQAFRGDIRVAVLNACFSLPQAQAIAGVVGCAIGTRSEISDQAAITFAASFYRAIAFSQSIKAAYDQARAALALEHFDERECPQLLVRTDVDPARLILVPANSADAVRRRRPLLARVIAWIALPAAALAATVTLQDRITRLRERTTTDTASAGAPHAPADTASARDSAAPAVQVRVPAAPPSSSRGGQAETTQRDAGSKSDEPLQPTLDAGSVRKVGVPDDSFSVPVGRQRNTTLPPAYRPR
ncbi:MAG TPA: CHAT domain-containing protein [Longimicrobiaceae bacterium]|nr:CHAT domain-containing protein [Longimicrobiaceae bacterium]